MSAEQQVRVRPESMLARNFSEDLDSLFGLHSGTTIGNLNETVQEKKRTVSTQEQELAALEQRLRDAEQRLAQAAGDKVANGQASAGAEEATTLPRRVPVPSASQLSSGKTNANYVPTASRPANPRAESSFNPPIPGAMPRTPTPRFEGRDYVAVDRTR